MLRSQAFDMHEPNPRMLPRQFNPSQLNVDCTIKSPSEQAEAQPPAKTGRATKGGSRASRHALPFRYLIDCVFNNARSCRMSTK